MKDRETDKIFGTGLVFALILFVVGNVLIVLLRLTPLPMKFGNTIVTGLVAYMGRSLANKITALKLQRVVMYSIDAR